ncbi:hypothetical protein GCM10009639_49840 [Kitasatospora putterlickiae]|uniref:Uncharacterized protein n=1 Tax=Kitasatospora putterlickiae TaxID=221725 RepID=A0ABN1YHL5_9ACTN
MLGPRDLSPGDPARTVTEELGRPVRYRHQPLDAPRVTLLGHGLNAAFAEGLVDVKRAKDEGLDAAVERSPQADRATGFAQRCA